MMVRKVMVMSEDGNFKVKYERKIKLLWLFPVWVSMEYSVGYFFYKNWLKQYGINYLS